jgi:hypothetical protein
VGASPIAPQRVRTGAGRPAGRKRPTAARREWLLPRSLPPATPTRADTESHHLDTGRACGLADGAMLTELCSRTRATDRWDGRPSIQLAGWS